MTITKTTLIIPIKSKPRGQLNKFGNMTHSLGGYRQWQKKALDALQKANFKTPNSWYRLLFEFHIKPKRGHKNDGSNMQGAIEDALVKGGYIIDDNWGILPRTSISVTKSTFDHVVLYWCDYKKDYIYLISNIVDQDCA